MSGQVFKIKTYETRNGFKSIILQNENGPCALVALCNVLIMQNTLMAAYIQSRVDHGEVNSLEISTKLIQILESGNKQALITPQFLQILSNLDKGLDVNPKFDGNFALSPELEIFNAFDVLIIHGWILGSVELDEIGAENQELQHVSYEEFCDQQFSESPNSEIAKFVDMYPTQLTVSGYSNLIERLKSIDFAILFWNNHFSTVTYRNGFLCTLVSDLGFKNEPQICWEVVDISGAGFFLNGDFEEPREPDEYSFKKSPANTQPKTQVKPASNPGKPPGKSAKPLGNKPHNAPRTQTSAPHKQEKSTICCSLM